MNRNTLLAAGGDVGGGGGAKAVAVGVKEVNGNALGHEAGGQVGEDRLTPGLDLDGGLPDLVDVEGAQPARLRPHAEGGT